MAYEIPGAYQITLEAAADLTAQQYKWVKLDGNGKIVPIAAITDRPVGILQDAPASGRPGCVMVCGVSMISANASISAGVVAGTSNDGQVVAIVPGTDTTQYILGQMLEGAGAANEYGTVLFDCRAPGRAA